MLQSAPRGWPSGRVQGLEPRHLDGFDSALWGLMIKKKSKRPLSIASFFIPPKPATAQTGAAGGASCPSAHWHLWISPLPHWHGPSRETRLLPLGISPQPSGELSKGHESQTVKPEAELPSAGSQAGAWSQRKKVGGTHPTAESGRVLTKHRPVMPVASTWRWRAHSKTSPSGRGVFKKKQKTTRSTI